jgi:hypothetical protein
MAQFVVVDFYKEKTIDFVPVAWVTGNKCYWPTPPNSTKKLTSIQLRMRDDPTSQPGKDWYLHKIKILRFCGKCSMDMKFLVLFIGIFLPQLYLFTDSLEKARNKTARKEKDPLSNLESEPSTSIVRKRKPSFKRNIEPAHRDQSSSEDEQESSSDSDEPNSPLLNFRGSPPADKESTVTDTAETDDTSADPNNFTGEPFLPFVPN